MCRTLVLLTAEIIIVNLDYVCCEIKLQKAKKKKKKRDFINLHELTFLLLIKENLSSMVFIINLMYLFTAYNCFCVWEN